MYPGFGPLCSKTSRKTKSAFFIQALHGMNSRLPADTVREDHAANACCKSGVRLKIPGVCPCGPRHSGQAQDEGGCLVVHAVAYHPGGRFECACPTARTAGCPACSGIRSLILFSLKTIALPRAEVSRLRARPKGFPIALWKPSGRPFDAMLLMQNSMTGRAECPPHPAI